MIAIQCKNIKKSYGSKETLIQALKGINLEIEQGKLTLLVGPSGSGKTTLLSIIANLLTPDEGEIFLLDQEMSRMPTEKKSEFCRKHLGVIFQSLFLIPSLTVAENVALPLIIDGESEERAKEKSMEILNKMKIAHRAETSPSNLSKGQQQRVAIARAIINESQILVCDEPTSALDQVSGHEIMTVFKELSTSPTRAVLIVTHDPRTFPFADKIIDICDGQIISGKDHA